MHFRARLRSRAPLGSIFRRPITVSTAQASGNYHVPCLAICAICASVNFQSMLEWNRNPPSSAPLQVRFRCRRGTQLLFPPAVRLGPQSLFNSSLPSASAAIPDLPFLSTQERVRHNKPSASPASVVQAARARSLARLRWAPSIICTPLRHLQFWAHSLPKLYPPVEEIPRVCHKIAAGPGIVPSAMACLISTSAVPRPPSVFQGRAGVCESLLQCATAGKTWRAPLANAIPAFKIFRVVSSFFWIFAPTKKCGYARQSIPAAPSPQKGQSLWALGGNCGGSIRDFFDTLAAPQKIS